MSDEEAQGTDRAEGDGNDSDEGDSERSGGGVCRPGVDRLSAPAVESQASRSAEGALEKVDETASPLDLEETGARELEEHGPSGSGAESNEAIETKLRWEGPGKIVYEPRLVRTGPDRFAVEARRERRGVIPWGFWGGLLFLGVATAAIVGAENFYTLWDVLWVLAGLTLGALLYRFGRQSTLEDVVLCTVDEGRRVLEWPEGAQSGLDATIAGFDDINEVVFGMTALPVDEGRPDVRVDAFALLVRTCREELIPVVEGSPYKGGVHEIAKVLADVTETELTYVGRGIEGE